MDYSQETADLIDRMCAYVERKDYELNQESATECILKTYDLFGLPRPKKVVWVKDPFIKKYDDAAGSARSAWSARSVRSAWSAGLEWSAGSARSARSARSAGLAWSARSARSARSAGSEWSAGSAWSAWSEWSAGSARSARSAWSARSAGSAGLAWSARSALDEDFWYYVFSFEYVRNPDQDKLPNEHDQKYLEYSELLLQALEHGAGYRVEWQDTLYIAPCPIVRIDEQNRFHSEDFPAIQWKGSKRFYYLKGENFDKDLWTKITKKTITATEVLQIPDSDKREIAFSLLGPNEMLKGLKAKLIHTGKKGNRLYECKNFRDTGDTEYCLVMDDASTPRQFIKFVPPEVGSKGDADVATAEGYKDAQGNSMPLEDYLNIGAEA